MDLVNRIWWLALCLTAVIIAIAGCGPDLYLMHKIEERVDGEDWINRGGGCMAVGDGSSSGMGGGSVPGSGKTPYEVSLTVDDGEAEFTATVDGKRVAHRTLDYDFLESNKKERVTFAVSDTEDQRFTFWGGSECEPPESPDK
jgi:hypothetical protein